MSSILPARRFPDAPAPASAPPEAGPSIGPKVRSLAQTTAFAAGGQGGAAEGTIYTADFTFSDFGIRFSVPPSPASQTDPDIGVAVQF